MIDNKDFVLTKDDFTVTGETQAVDEASNYNFVNKFGKDMFWWTFTIGDDLTTNRGITIGSTMQEVFKKYTEEEIFDFVPYDDVLFQGTLELHEDGFLKQEMDFAESNKVDFGDINEIKKAISENYIGDFKNFKGGEKWVEYSFPDVDTKIIYVLRFYFDSDEKVVLIAFYDIDCNLKESNPLIDYKIIYDLQYVTLPAILFYNTKDIIRSLVEDTYGLISSYYARNLIACPFDKEDFVTTNKIIYVDNDTFNLLTIKFEIPMSGILSREIRIAYSNDFKNVRYFTIETNALKNNIDEIYFCEVFKGGRENYGEMIYDENAIEKEIIDIYTNKIITTGMVTKFPKRKPQNNEINKNDKPWIGIRGESISEFNMYEPESKLKNVKGILIYCLELGSSFKECNLDFDTENIITIFDGKEVSSREDLKAVIDEHKPGDKVKVTIDVYDNKNDALLPRDYIITIGSKNDETYKFNIDYETMSKTLMYWNVDDNRKKE